MKKKTLSQATNTMRRALVDLVDPPPSEKLQRRLREHFADLCAYCGLAAEPRSGHIDRARPGGGNGLGNLLLACKECNGDLKREMNWEEFIAIKCGHDSTLLATRRTKILEWFGLNVATPKVLTPSIEAAQREAAAAIEAYEVAYNRLRDAVLAAQTVERSAPPRVINLTGVE